MPLSLSSIIDYILLFGHNTPTNDTIPEAETLKDLSSGEGISEFCVTLLAGWLISLSANLSLGVFFVQIRVGSTICIWSCRLMLSHQPTLGSMA